MPNVSIVELAFARDLSRADVRAQVIRVTTNDSSVDANNACTTV